ncbi:hypothetical protein [uncultured Psychroserpens sp.]|uniref:hypothetical protein n=1 Tax=uncultured Psychroserpens sp. TaxID=255436 RepID=UPI00262DBDDF|nr:hypothetical protein [uncultured Psychroserpens sp.]
MKKLITLCVFTLALLFSSQGLNAQSKIEINGAASEKAKELRSVIKFNNTQLEQVYQAYKVYETTYQTINNDLEANKKLYDKINVDLDNRLKEIFNEEQYDTYIAIYRNENQNP